MSALDLVLAPLSWRLLSDKSQDKLEWHRHALLWGWTGFYFIWQSLAFNPTMRYQLPIYPALAIFAAWAVIELWDSRKRAPATDAITSPARNWMAFLAFVLGASVLVASAAWAYAFTGIYRRPTTRVEASHWIYQNVPAAINLHIDTEDGQFNQPLPYAYGAIITQQQPYISAFTPKESGLLTQISFARAVAPDGTSASWLI